MNSKKTLTWILLGIILIIAVMLCMSMWGFAEGVVEDIPKQDVNVPVTAFQ